MGKLTVRGIENAKPKDKAYKLMDGDGLQLRVATDGVKTWLVRYVIQGVERQYRLPKLYRDVGGSGFCSLQDAREASAEIRALARQGIDYKVRLDEECHTAEQKRLAEAKRLSDEAAMEQEENLTVQSLFGAWIRDGVRRKDGNAGLSRSFKADVLPLIGNKPIKNLSEHDIRDVLRVLVGRGVNRTAVVLRDNLVQMFAWAGKRQPWRKLLIDGNPMDLIEIEKIVSPDYDMDCERKRTLSTDEIRELRDIFERSFSGYKAAPNKRRTKQPIELSTQHAIWIMLSTMCRVGETSMARWEHINWEARTWFIPKENVKANLRDFRVYLSDFALDHFQQLHKLTGHSEWCFPAKIKGGHIGVEAISKQVGLCQEMFMKDKSGNPRKATETRPLDNSLVLSGGATGNWTPHDMRRTGATLMQSLKVDLLTIDLCQNHVIPGSKTRRHYLHWEYEDEMREAWRLLGERLSLILQLNPVDNVVMSQTGL